jgi:hypothetical protein
MVIRWSFLVVLHDIILLDENMCIVKGNKKALISHWYGKWAKNKDREI